MDRVLLLVCVFAFTAVAAYGDWRTQKVPNALVVPTAIAGLVYHVVFGALASGWSGAGTGLVFSLAGFATGFGALFLLWAIGGGGGGDVKYMGALGAWLGSWMTLQVLLVGTIFAVFSSLGVIAWQFFRRGPAGVKKYRRKEQPVSGGEEAQARSLQRRAVQRRLMPFAVPAGLAAWCVLIVNQFVLKN